MNKKMRIVSLALCLFLTLGFSPLAAPTTLDGTVTNTAKYMADTVISPAFGSVGGEWAVLGLARSFETVPADYFSEYYENICDYVTEKNGILHDKKYTEYSRLALALTAIGKDAQNVNGYNILSPLADYEKTIWQGINGPIWVLIALDSGNYPMPQNPDVQVQATRDMYVDRILELQLSDGGFSLSGGGSSDPDITGMALQALSKYQARADVKLAAERAVTLLSKMQNDDGGYSSYASTNSESVVQVIVALCELSIPLDDARFVKSGHTLLDNLLSFYTEGSGFAHTSAGTGSNQMATEQGLYGIVAAQRALNNKNSLYNMSDAISVPDSKPPMLLPIKHPGKSFSDITTHKNRAAIEALAERGILDGKSDAVFEPDASMTRAELAAVLTRVLDLPPSGENIFSDVPQTEWFFDYVTTAASHKIVTGTGDNLFSPYGTLTRAEVAVMVVRTANLFGLDITMSNDAVRDTLSAFTDYTAVPSWAAPGLAFCYSENIIGSTATEILHDETLSRGEISQMLFNMLVSAKKI